MAALAGVLLGVSGVSPPPLRGSAGGSALGVGSGLVLAALSWLGFRSSALLRDLAGEFRRLLGRLTLGEAVGLAVLSGVAEELLFRGVLLPWWGWSASTLVFGLMHLPFRSGAWPWTLFALVAGGWMGWLTLETGSLAPAILCHVGNNAVGLAWIGRLPAPAGDSAAPGERSIPCP